MIVLPPLDGAIHVTVALPLPALAVTPLGADGVVHGVTALECSEAGPLPIVVGGGDGEGVAGAVAQPA